MGFTDVADFVGGKEDWVLNGLPVEGEEADAPRAIDVARPVPTCALDTPLADIAERIDRTNRCVVVNERGVVAGVVKRSALEHLACDAAFDNLTAEAVMEPGPSTYRAGVDAHSLVHRLQDAGARVAILTTADGILVGLFDRDEVRDALSRGGSS